MTLPLSSPLRNSAKSMAIHVPEGTFINVGIAAANRDPLIWGPDADQWRPERWLGKTIDEVAQGDKLPGVYSGMFVYFTRGWMKL